MKWVAVGGYGGQKGVRVRDYWDCWHDGLIDFTQILDQSPRVWHRELLATTNFTFIGLIVYI